MAHNLPFENRNGTIYISTAARQQIQFSAVENEPLEKDNLEKAIAGSVRSISTNKALLLARLFK